jgi:hypothetical protein
LDTREKIVPLSDVPQRVSQDDWLAVVGTFDPLTAQQAARVAELANGGRRILAIVLEEAETLLEPAARAALMAGLRTVQLVTVAKPHEWRGALNGANVQVAEDAEGERARSAEFAEFVLQRQLAGRGRG